MLKCAIGGGMAVQKVVADGWFKATGRPIIEGYGLSETSPSATCNPVDSTSYSGNIGLPMPNTELALLDDDGKEVPLGQPGEIVIRGPQVMAGYWQRPDETAKVMTADGFFRTGDIGVVDERGHGVEVDERPLGAGVGRRSWDDGERGVAPQGHLHRLAGGADVLED